MQFSLKIINNNMIYNNKIIQQKKCKIEFSKQKTNKSFLFNKGSCFKNMIF